jgi:hypothetical protein
MASLVIFLFIFLVILKANLLSLTICYVNSTNKFSSLASRTSNGDRRLLVYRPFIRRSLEFAFFLNLNFLDCRIDNLINKLVSLTVLNLVIISLTSFWLDHIWLFWASCVLNGISSSNTLPVLNHMMLGGCILHVDEAFSGRCLSLVKHLWCLILELVLESGIELVCCILWAFDFLHFFPNLFNV